jgi:hypothetical protein
VGHREGAGTACLLPAGRVGTSFSRVRVPDGAGEAKAVASWQNKFSRTLPRPVGASLRHRRRAHGDGAPIVESFYKSVRILPFCHFRKTAESAVRFVQGAEMAMGVADSWRVDRAQFPFDVGRRRALIHDRRSLG